MIVDHLLTRTGVRSLGLVLAGVVPLASWYLFYMLAYNETPVDTLMNQLPFMLQLLQANSSTSSLLFQNNNSGNSLLPSIPFDSATVPATTVISSIAAAAVSAIASPSASTSTTTEQSIPGSNLSVLRRSIVALVQFLDAHGYKDVRQLPGYQYWIALQPLKERLGPVLNFISSHQTLTWILTGLHLWMAAELVFCFMFWKKLARLQEVDRVVKGVGAKAKRRELFERCLETVDEGEGVKRWIEVWFDTGRTKQPAKFEDIGRANMVSWMAWAFWAAPLEEVAQSPAAIIELNEMIDTIEEVKKVKFREGYNPNVDCIRLSLDPVIASHRPLIYYTLIWLANALTKIVFLLLGFTRYSGTLDQAHTFEQTKFKPKHRKSSSFSSPGAIAAENRPPGDLAYWYRTPAKPQNPIPLVFIHGIGVGLVQYIHLVVALTFISRPLIMIEVPEVSNQLVQVDCMTPDETYFVVERILRIHKHPKATFLGHSLGTMLCAAICRASPASSPKSIVHGLILTDPICFLTHHSIARNFAYRTPATASQLVMDLFAAREIGTSWFIMRRFCWTESIIFPIAWSRRHQKPLVCQGKLSPVLPQRTRVFLSRNDNLLDMDKVAEYLRTKVGLEEGTEKDELVVMDGLDHAQLLLRPEWFSRILKAAREC
ncbi:hypothetical protein BG015_010765 [Linnemannia schmuckeri]|uniref:AB hydrolase-1 domain-containing protein n=1 Tax=Linnemannia schmuckeri TaxID=64567 RepID=A0A9P5S8M7_9FUNG|nr:hypothetical protein BG015_010765 [Linnemannia schmuckeri]